ncbi:hypothetical protein GCM10009623_33760 [Nocardioides aestuarii]|uniref:Transcription termination/antitermination protein NusG n=1 Tax=Nocardioides aestuarii TaxID=252231 RepID=A0ABW4TSU2_9ACTN
MSESESETSQTDADGADGIDDEQLPEDLQPGEDNPLAEAPDEEELPDDLDVLGGKGAEQDHEDAEDAGES